MTTVTERFFRDSEYWRPWSQVPDMTADISSIDGTGREE
jgi:hypothetical protein